MAFQTTSSEFSNMRPTLMTPGDIQCNFYTNSNPTPYMVTNPSWASPTDQLGHWQNVSSLGPIQVTNNHGSNMMPIGPSTHGHWYFRPSNHQMPLDIFTILSEDKKIKLSLESIESSLELLVLQSRDPEFEKFEKFESILNRMNDTMTKAIDNVNKRPYDKNIMKIITETQKQSTLLLQKIHSSAELIYKNLEKCQKSKLSEIDLDDIQSSTVFPIFDGKQDIESLNIYQFINLSTSFFKRRGTKDSVKASYIKNHIASPAKNLIFRHIENEDNFKHITSKLIQYFGKYTHMYQELNFQHDNVGHVPSTKGNNIPWNTIAKRVRLHILLLYKAIAIGENFYNHFSYLGMIRNYLPLDCITSLDDDAKFSRIKNEYLDIERQASRINSEIQDADSNEGVSINDIDLTASFM